jgi:proteasomal ATPase-associated factor 1
MLQFELRAFSNIQFRAIAESAVVPLGPGSTSFDVCPTKNLLAVGYSDGHVTVYDASSGGEIKKLPFIQFPNVEVELTVTRFFPSGEVLMTAGLDTRICVTRIDDAFTGAVLKGIHTARVVDTAFVGRGRNIFSCAADGSVCLWECGTGRSVWSRKSDDRASCTIVVSSEVPSDRPPAGLATLHFGTEGHLAVVGHESGRISVFDIRSSEPALFISSLPSCINAVTTASASILRFGTEDGKVTDVDVRYPSAMIQYDPFLSASSVRALCGTWVGSNDGHIICLEPNRQYSTFLTGTDTYPITGLAKCGDRVYSLAKDNVVRVYDV